MAKFILEVSDEYIRNQADPERAAASIDDKTSGVAALSALFGVIAIKQVKDEIDKFRSLMADHYRGGCRWKSERGTEYRDEPDVDYQPSASLFGLLVKAGCKEDDANDMCPWKTGITINQRDNSVCIRGYRTARYI